MSRLCTLMLLYLFISSIFATNPKQRIQKQNAALKKKEVECKIQCKDEAEKEMCIKNCLSPTCYQKLFVGYELEPGEIDTREERFKQCSGQELEKISNSLKQNKSNSSSASLNPTTNFLQIFGILAVLLCLLLN